MIKPKAFVLLTVLGAACHAPGIVTVAPESIPNTALTVSGVDSLIVMQAAALADSAIVGPEESVRSTDFKREGLLLAALGATLADSTLAFIFPTDSVGSTSTESSEVAVRSFNDGARVLDSYAKASDAVRAVALLAEAQSLFEDALRANPFDEESRYWLARTYSVRASALGEAGAHAEASQVLERLFAMHQDRHDYAGLLAQSVEEEGNLGKAVKLWLLAATTASDDATMQDTVADSSAIFTYYVRGCQAAIMVQDSAIALHLLAMAEQWHSSMADSLIIAAERAVVQWDGGNLRTRAIWDSLRAVSASDVGSAVRGMERLLPRLESTTARIEARHQLAVFYHKLERHKESILMLQAAWKEASRDSIATDFDFVREDYGAIAYNLGQARLRAGDRVSALAYFLQSEATGFSGTARAAFDVALLLRNHPASALAAAQRADLAIGQLDSLDRLALLRYLIELHRRRGEREEALRVLARLSAM